MHVYWLNSDVVNISVALLALSRLKCQSSLWSEARLPHLMFSSLWYAKSAPPPSPCLSDPRNPSLVAQLAPNLHPSVSALNTAKHSSSLLTKEEWTRCLNICLSVILPTSLLKEPRTFQTSGLIKPHWSLQSGLCSIRTTGSPLMQDVSVESGFVVLQTTQQHSKGHLRGVMTSGYFFTVSDGYRNNLNYWSCAAVSW